MSDNNLWYGYLEAGEKSSPVVMDSRLNTANPATLYLFNFKRGEIIEYRRDIIEAKLRALESTQDLDEKTLKSAYTAARSSFTPRGAKISELAEKPSPKQEPKKRTAAVDEEDDEALDALMGDDVSGDDDWEDD